MPALTCGALNCRYNADRLCTKGDIKVDGHEARRPGETCCASFMEESGEKNSCDCGCGQHLIDVHCEAEKCTFNHSEHCEASSIDIEGSGACECHETQCGSFRCENC